MRADSGGSHLSKIVVSPLPLSEWFSLWVHHQDHLTMVQYNAGTKKLNGSSCIFAYIEQYLRLVAQIFSPYHFLHFLHPVQAQDLHQEKYVSATKQQSKRFPPCSQPAGRDACAPASAPSATRRTTGAQPRGLRLWIILDRRFIEFVLDRFATAHLRAIILFIRRFLIPLVLFLMAVDRAFRLRGLRHPRVRLAAVVRDFLIGEYF
jgi:hypothetical protein